VGADQFVKASS